MALANWVYIDGSNRVAIIEAVAAGGARDLALHVALNVSICNRLSGILLHIERPLLNCAIELPQILDARVLARGVAGFGEVGNRNGRQQTDDGDYNHDFHQRETPLSGTLNDHTLTFLLSRRERSSERL